MKAYFVHGNDGDWVVIPDAGKAARVSPKLLGSFLGPDPWFENWEGDPVKGAPDSYGRVVATRNDEAPVVVVDDELWDQRKMHWIQVAQAAKAAKAAKTAEAPKKEPKAVKIQEEEWKMDDV